MYPFVYKVTCVSEFNNYKAEKRQGVTFGATFKEAMERVESYYGDELVDCWLYPFDDAQSIIELSKEEVRRIVDGC